MMVMCSLMRAIAYGACGAGRIVRGGRANKDRSVFLLHIGEEFGEGATMVGRIVVWSFCGLRAKGLPGESDNVVVFNQANS